MTKVFLFGPIGWYEVLIIAFIVLLLFGGKKIPELMNGLGKGVRSFKDGMKKVENEVNKVDTEIKETDNQEKK